MRCKGKTAAAHIAALLAVFAMLAGFTLTGTDFFPAVISSAGGEDTLSELAYHFPGNAGEPAILDKTDDSGHSFFRFANHKFFDLFGSIGHGSASNFSRLQSHSTKNSFDNNSTILIKLRI